ncbi:hypothetical protein B0J12DRAFT_644860 [Macrophomina phaseolina]|uniref:Uncharacterized protein n=1 Tax=Macrophomina phaseolina TaxID=35725 RepID=A0ABQ8GQ07_9PEZI|nr:hypothetical protein B0J12DRAFT_644860 [Macrophomina phaseolina]
MAAVITHHCRACSYNTPVLFSASVFSQNHTCNHCGIISTGLGPQPGTAAAKEADMQQDELAALFHQSLNFQTPAHVGGPAPQAQAEQMHEHHQQQEQGQHIDLDQQKSQEEQQQQEPRQPIIYASTHYTPNAAHHLISRPASAPNLNTTPPPAAPPTAAETTSPAILLPSARTNPQLISIFARHSIDISDLSPGQLELFTAADLDQQLRLLELWRITLRGAAAEDGVWTSATSLEMEEALARERWERLQSQHQRQQHIHIDTSMDMMTDDDGTTTSDASASPTSLASPTLRGMHAEPYMLSGYEQLAIRDYESQTHQQQHHQQHQPQQRQGMVHGYGSGATDPVYKAAVENRYGAFQAMREYGYESTSGGAAAGGWADDDMVM